MRFSRHLVGFFPYGREVVEACAYSSREEKRAASSQAPGGTPEPCSGSYAEKSIFSSFYYNSTKLAAPGNVGAEA